MARKRVSRQELHDILVREFRNTAGDACLACRIPLPSYFAPGEATGVNWRLAGMEECPSLCHTIVMDLFEKLSEEYAVTRPRK